MRLPWLQPQVLAHDKCLEPGCGGRDFVRGQPLERSGLVAGKAWSRASGSTQVCVLCGATSALTPEGRVRVGWAPQARLSQPASEPLRTRMQFDGEREPAAEPLAGEHLWEPRQK